MNGSRTSKVSIDVRISNKHSKVIEVFNNRLHGAELGNWLNLIDKGAVKSKLILSSHWVEIRPIDDIENDLEEPFSLLGMLFDRWQSV